MANQNTKNQNMTNMNNIAKNSADQGAQTNAQEVRQQNLQSAQSAGGNLQSSQSAGGNLQAGQAAAGNLQSFANGNFQTEFASETNAQEVRQQNQQSMAKKNKNQF